VPDERLGGEEEETVFLLFWSMVIDEFYSGIPRTNSSYLHTRLEKSIIFLV